MRPYIDSKTTAVAKALGEPVRFATFREIAARTEVTAGELQAYTSVSKPTVSHHLKILARAGLVESRRDGVFIYYRIVPETLSNFCILLHSLIIRVVPPIADQRCRVRQQGKVAIEQVPGVADPHALEMHSSSQGTELTVVKTSSTGKQVKRRVKSSLIG